MPIRKLRLTNVGQISEAAIRLGDLTVLVGPQATGKSVFLQFLKLVADTGLVMKEMKTRGLEWQGSVDRFLDAYLGEGMQGIWRKKGSKSGIEFDGKAFDLVQLADSWRKPADETVFYIPAQRVLTLQNSWPRSFTEYRPGDPYVVRDFSEKLRLLIEQEFRHDVLLFPQERRLKTEIRDRLRNDVFGGFELGIDIHGVQKRLVLKPSLDRSVQKETISFMAWSAGQREFVPLLLGLYWLLPRSAQSTRDKYDMVIIEEPETGLHPKGISTVLLLVLELLGRGYRVCLSTHSPYVLDMVWALGVIKEHKANPNRILDLFDVPKTGAMPKLAAAVTSRTARVYYFDPVDGAAHDISGLDPGAPRVREAGWGGLNEFSGRAAEVVASVVNEGRA